MYQHDYAMYKAQYPKYDPRHIAANIQAGLDGNGDLTLHISDALGMAVANIDVYGKRVAEELAKEFNY